MGGYLINFGLVICGELRVCWVFCRFRGAVRNLVYGAVTGGIGGGASSVVKPQEIVESKVRWFGVFVVA